MSSYYRRGKRGGWQQSTRSHYQKTSTVVSSAPVPPLGTLIQSLNKHDLVEDANNYLDRASIQDCELVASYNWLDKSDPAMLIPGTSLPLL